MDVFTFLLICFVLYFLPAILAIQKQHVNTTAIVILNVFLGWTLLGWVGALVWVFTKKG